MSKESSTAEWERYRIEQAERWLNACRRLVDLEKSMQLLADSQREMADGIGGLDYAKMTAKTRPSADAIPNAVAKYLELAEDFDAMAADIGEKRKAVALAVSSMSDALEASVITRYYLVGQTWEEICVDLSYSWRGIMNLRRRALLSAYDVMPAHERDPRHQAV